MIHKVNSLQILTENKLRDILDQNNKRFGVLLSEMFPLLVYILKIFVLLIFIFFLIADDTRNHNRDFPHKESSYCVIKPSNRQRIYPNARIFIHPDELNLDYFLAV